MKYTLAFVRRDTTGEKRKGNFHANAGSFRKGSHVGEKHPRWTPDVIVHCAWCKCPFGRKRHAIKDENKCYCTTPCYKAYRKSIAGEKHWAWRGGHDEYRGANWKKERLLAVARDNGRCQRCGLQVGTGIDVHHIRPYRLFKSADKANVLDNLMCLCARCHKKVEWETDPTYALKRQRAARKGRPL
jgi:5-methylcytosine-specific restriction endonuclease McrA